MERKEKNNKDYYVIDLMNIVKSLWKKAWAILLISVICGGLAFGYTALFVKPMYSSSALLYVNNRSISLPSTGVSISAGELSAAQSLVDTYIGILRTRTTMERVIEETGTTHSYGSLLRMISTSAVTGTEIFRVTVTCEDPYEAEKIANGITAVLPERIENIVEGTSMKVVDEAIVNTSKVSPNNTTNTIVGVLIGFVLSCALFTIITLMDDTIRDEDHIVQTYDTPILAKIPNLMFEDSKRSYSHYGRYGYGYGSRRSKMAPIEENTAGTEEDNQK
jgi:capsular polysaccharide biosynthesis protein